MTKKERVVYMGVLQDEIMKRMLKILKDMEFGNSEQKNDKAHLQAEILKTLADVYQILKRG